MWIIKIISPQQVNQVHGKVAQSKHDHDRHQHLRRFPPGLNLSYRAGTSSSVRCPVRSWNRLSGISIIIIVYTWWFNKYLQLFCNFNIILFLKYFIYDYLGGFSECFYVKLYIGHTNIIFDFFQKFIKLNCFS